MERSKGTSFQDVYCNIIKKLTRPKNIKCVQAHFRHQSIILLAIHKLPFAYYNVKETYNPRFKNKIPTK